jgi:quercetin dioxygenase-like cupin family protein
MQESDPRSPPKTPSLFVQGAALPPIALQALEGQGSVGRVDIKPMMVGDDMLMVEFFQQAGVRIPVHVHEDHESIVYLVRGRMELAIGDTRFIAVAGDAWRHPLGVAHSSLALEDCVAVEVKSPPRRTWNVGSGVTSAG